MDYGAGLVGGDKFILRSGNAEDSVVACGVVEMENLDPVIRHQVEKAIGIPNKRHHANAGTLFHDATALRPLTDALDHRPKPPL